MNDKDQLKQEYSRVAEEERQKAAKKKRIEGIFIVIGVIIAIGVVIMFVGMMSGGGSGEDGGNFHERMQKMHGMVPSAKVIS